MDNAQEFRSKLLKTITPAYGIRPAFSSPYQPQGNGIAEACEENTKGAAFILYSTRQQDMGFDDLR